MFMVLDLTSSLRAKFLPDMTAGHLQMSVRIARVLAQVCMLKPEAIDDKQYNLPLAQQHPLRNNGR